MKAVGTVRIYSGWSLTNSFFFSLGEKFDVTDEKEKVKMSHRCGLGEWGLVLSFAKTGNREA